MDNGAWCFHLIDQLICQGVDRFCIAPGSRSTPLALAVARHPKAKLTVHTDERGVAFFALGCANASGAPAAVITTSGTGAGNLLPAVMEAHHSSIPLLVLTADRPPELRDTGANQTTDQVKIFQNFLEWEMDLPCPSPDLGENFIRSQAAYAAFRAKSGPVQLNCQFREPLFTPLMSFAKGKKQPYFSHSDAPTEEQLAYAEEKISRAERGLILIGRTPNPKPILDLAGRLGWPVFADILSQTSSIRYFDFAIRSGGAPAPDLVLQFGGRFVSKFLAPWIQKSEAEVLHIEASGKRIDTQHTRPARIAADPALFCPAIQGRGKSRSYLEAWQEIDRILQEAVESCFAEPHPFVEPDFMRQLDSLDATLFLGNSMPVRDAAYFGSPCGPVFCNRGLSGIDGQIATLSGIAATTEKPVAAVLGDQSCLHDLNSLLLLRTIKTPVLLIISNNFGGGIFSYLPVAEEKDHFETLFAASHDIRFEGIANMLSIPYSSSSKVDRLEDFFPSSGPRILEIFTSRKENTSFQKRVLEKCSLAVTLKRSACLAEF